MKFFSITDLSAGSGVGASIILVVNTLLVDSRQFALIVPAEPPVAPVSAEIFVAARGGRKVSSGVSADQQVSDAEFEENDKVGIHKDQRHMGTSKNPTLLGSGRS